MFGNNTSFGHYSILLDIGSGSVSLSVLDDNKKHQVVWRNRESLLLKKLDTDEKVKKEILTALTNLLLKLHNEGIVELQKNGPTVDFTNVQITVAAPFMHTVTKRVQYSSDKPFPFTANLKSTLLKKAEEKIKDDEQYVSSQVSLMPVSRVLLAEYANGYKVSKPDKQLVSEVELVLLNHLIDKKIYEGIVEIQEKLFPNTSIEFFSFITALHHTVQGLHPEMSECCLVNQTLEATEVGIVRDGVLTYSTHSGKGISELVRNLADIFASPLEEMFYSLQSETFQLKYQKLSKKKQTKVDSILKNYQADIAELFDQTGDKHTIPKSIYLHTNSCTYDFFAQRIERGAENATGFQHIVHNLDAAMLLATGSQEATKKSCIELISRRFFHTFRGTIEYVQI